MRYRYGGVPQGRAKWDKQFHPFQPNPRTYAVNPCSKCHKGAHDPIHNVTAFGNPLGEANKHFDELLYGVIANIPDNMIKDLEKNRLAIYGYIKKHVEIVVGK